jgi:hypothetical protein
LSLVRIHGGKAAKIGRFMSGDKFKSKPNLIGLVDSPAVAGDDSGEELLQRIQAKAGAIE